MKGVSSIILEKNFNAIYIYIYIKDEQGSLLTIEVEKSRKRYVAKLW